MTHTTNRSIRLIILFIVTAVLLCVPLLADAQRTYTFESISGVPGINSGGGDAINTQEFLSRIYTMAIIAAAVIAVIKLMLAGAQYVLSGVVTKKENAKRDIRSALIGLLIILAAVTLLTTINPEITNLPALRNISNDLTSFTRTLPTSRAQAICNSPAGCGQLSCNSFLSVTWVGCQAMCNAYGGVIDNAGPVGVVNSGTCYYPNDVDTSEDYITQEIINNSPACADNGCAYIDCLWGAGSSCRRTCDASQGIFIDSGWFNADRCVYPIP